MFTEIGSIRDRRHYFFWVFLHALCMRSFISLRYIQDDEKVGLCSIQDDEKVGLCYIQGDGKAGLCCIQGDEKAGIRYIWNGILEETSQYSG